MVVEATDGYEDLPELSEESPEEGRHPERSEGSLYFVYAAVRACPSPHRDRTVEQLGKPTKIEETLSSPPKPQLYCKQQDNRCASVVTKPLYWKHNKEAAEKIRGFI